MARFKIHVPVIGTVIQFQGHESPNVYRDGVAARETPGANGLVDIDDEAGLTDWAYISRTHYTDFTDTNGSSFASAADVVSYVDAAIAAGPGDHPGTLSELADVTVGTPTSTDVLSFNGTVWATSPAKHTATAILDVEELLTLTRADGTTATVDLKILKTDSISLSAGTLTLTQADASFTTVDVSELETTSVGLAGDVITITRGNGSTATTDLGHLRSASGVVDGATGILTITRADATTFDLDLSAFLSTGGSAGIFLGYTQNQAQMDLLSPSDLDYTIRTDTDTVWQYQTAAWVDTLAGTIHLESIVANAVAGIPTIPSISYSAPLSTTGGVVGVGDHWANTGTTGHNLNTVLFDQPILAGDTDKWWTWTALPGTGGGAGHNFAVGITDTATSASLGNGTLNDGWLFASGHYGSTGGLWYYGPNSGLVGAGYIHAMSYIVGGGDFRAGRDTDGKLKFQFKLSGTWTSIMAGSSTTLGDADDLYLAWDLYNGPAQGSSIVYAPEAPYAVTATPAQTGTYASTHYVDFDGTNDHVVFSGTATDDFMDWDGPKGDWSIGFTWDGRLSTQAQNQQYMTLFSNGTNQIAFRQGGSNQGIYFKGSSTSSWGINTWYAPVLGDKYLFEFNAVAKTIQVWRNGFNQGSVNAVHLVDTYNGADGVFTIGKGVSGWDSFDGGLSDIYLRKGAHLGTAQRDEYFLTADLTATTFYADTESIDFLRVGEETYPAVNGLKAVALGTFTNGTSADFVQK